MTHAHIHVYVPLDDEGTSDCYFHIYNGSSSALSVQQVYIDQFLINGSVANVAPPMYTPPKEPIRAQDGRELYARFLLTRASIRQLIGAIQPAQNLRSSPRVEIGLSGSIQVVFKKRGERLRFRVSTTTPELTLSAPSALG